MMKGFLMSLRNRMSQFESTMMNVHQMVKWNNGHICDKVVKEL
jgi:hypothetical protein